VFLGLGGFGQEIKAGEHDAELRAFLNEALSLVTLRETTVADVAPEFALPEADKEADWMEALDIAGKAYPDSPMHCALYLWKHLPENADPALLKDLDLDGDGSVWTTGSGFSHSLILIEKAFIPKRDSFIDIIEVHPKALLNFWISHGSDKRLFGPGYLEIHDVLIGNLSFTALHFDTDEKLIGFGSKRKLPAGIVLTIGGNTTGTDGTDFYYLNVSINNRRFENISLSPDLLIADRWVNDLTTGKTIYREVYQAGKPIKRNFYGEIKSEYGTQSVITLTEIINNSE